MSTRCQVQVIQKGLTWEGAVTLYHHTDGYPEYMVPKIKEAFNFQKANHFIMPWERGRAGKVASLLCAVDPAVFEPEEGHELHGDIEFFYRIICQNPEGGHFGDNPYWDVEIYKAGKKFWDDPRAEKLQLLKTIRIEGQDGKNIRGN